jgi:hypothetical protein
VSSARAVHVHPSTTSPEAQSSALARIYARALQRYEESQKAAEPAPELDSRDDAKESNGCIATGRLPRRN